MSNTKNKKGVLFLLGGVFAGIAVGALCFMLTVKVYQRYGAKIKKASKKISFAIDKTVDGKAKDVINTAVEKIPTATAVASNSLVFNVRYDQALRPINPLIYGSNLTTKTEFEMRIAKFAKDVGITNFRFPGGGSPGYRWKQGDFDFTDRTDNAPLSELKNVIEFSKIAGAGLVIQVNVESGTPQEAADWVAHMNNDKNFRVDYWELGNEVYGNWDKAHMNGEKYAQLIKEYSTAMKAVDPTIKIGADWGGPKYQQFDEAVIKGAADYIDFVSYHWYPNHTNRDKAYRGRRHPLPNEVMANSLAVTKVQRRLNRLIAQYAPQRQGKIELTFMEWDGSWDAIPSDLKREYKGIMWSLANAIFFANTLGEFAKHGVTVANQYCIQEVMFGLIRGWDKQAGWGGSPWDTVTIRPKALAIKLVANYFGDIMLKGGVEGSPTYYKTSDWFADSYTGDVPYVQGYASKFSDENKVALLITNKDEANDYPLQINFEGIKPAAQGKAYVLTGPSLKAQNDGSPGTVKINQYNLTGVEQTFYYKVPPRSVTLIEVQGQ